MTASPLPAAARKAKKILIASLVILVVLFTGYTFATLSWTYASGERAGYVQKFSKKGWICKTWEGELAMVNLPGAMAEKFNFTVRNDSVAAAINTSLGKRVTLSYGQHVGVPTSCFGETPYYVSGVKVVE